jgi:hypothetical protein
MFAPATVGGVAPPADPLEALKLYSSLGLRSFPATYLDKTPHPKVGKWGALAERPPVPPQMWAAIVADYGRFNVALICDEHLIVIDLDNLDFVAWFDAQGPERLGTWIVRTPSGGLHVYVASDDPQRTTVIKAASGVKIGDVKARGGYVIAPPSVGSNGDYQTEYGSPDAIARQANAFTWFLGYVAAWERTQPVRLQPGMSDNQPEYANTDVHGAPPDARQEEMLTGLRTAWMNNTLNRKVYDTLTEGVDAADGYWKNPDDRSDIDFGCVKELINIGWTFPEIEELWTFAPVGDRYRSDARAHGHGYLLRTYDAAKRKWDADQVDLLTAVGPGWRVLLGAEWWREKDSVHYSFTLKRDDNGETFAIECDARAFATPSEFKRVVYAQAAFIDLGRFGKADGLATLGQVLKRLAVERPKPELSTRESHLRYRLRQVVEQFAMPRLVQADDALDDWLSWADGAFVYVNPPLLHRRMQRALMPTPTETETWQQWAALQGEQSQYRGKYCWRAPRQNFPDLRLS